MREIEGGLGSRQRARVAGEWGTWISSLDGMILQSVLNMRMLISLTRFDRGSNLCPFPFDFGSEIFSLFML